MRPTEDWLTLFSAYAALSHPSYETAAAAKMCASVARAAGCFADIDAAGNLLIRAPATPGYETHAPVILQGHLDMVCAREADAPCDPAREGLSLFEENGLLGARGTTLGGDDAVAVVSFLALLRDEKAAHPPLEILLTADEEVGMLGAAAFDTAALQGRRLLNLDSDREGVLTVGCAGGTTLYIGLPVCREKREGIPLTLTFSGGAGGHSGTEIHLGRLNTCHALAATLAALAQEQSFSLLSLSGGDKDNAIPTHAQASLLVSDAGAALLFLKNAAEEVKAACAESDPAFAFSLATHAQTEAEAVPPAVSAAWVGLLASLPCGVQQMSRELPDLVETSLNLGVLASDPDRLSAVYSLRSSVGEEKERLAARLTAVAEACGAEVCRTGDYPAWEYRPHSPLRTCMKDTYRALFGKEPTTEVIHAGLECGLFSDRIAGLDCVSFGPDLYDIHTTRERLSLASAARTYAYLCAVLRAL